MVMQEHCAMWSTCVCVFVCVMGVLAKGDKQAGLELITLVWVLNFDLILIMTSPKVK